MISRGVLAFSLSGSRVLVPLWWVAPLALLAAITAASLYSGGPSALERSAYFGSSVLVLLGGVGSLLMHETAHARIARRFHMPAGSLRLYLFGATPVGFGNPGSPRSELANALAGPLASLALGLVFGAGWLLLRFDHLLTGSLETLAVFNLGLAGLNLLPGFPLDGGRVLRALVWYLHDSYSAGTRAAVAYGQAISALALGSGAIVLGSQSPWKLLGAWILLAGWAIGSAGREELERADFVARGSAVSAGELVTGLNAHVGKDDSLEEALDAVLGQSNAGPALVTDSGVVVGILTLDGLRRDRARWSERTAGDVMISPMGLPSLPAGAPVSALLDHLIVGAVDVLVVTDDGEVVGAVDRNLAVRQLYRRGTRLARESRG